jgi:hypothetical protein
MSGSIVLYDHIAPLGVFHKKSPVSIKSVIQVLKKEFPGNDGQPQRGEAKPGGVSLASAYSLHVHM